MPPALSPLDDLIADVEVGIAEAHGEDTLNQVGEGDWREHPVDFDTFVLSREHLFLPPLFDRQRAAVIALLGADPTRIFEAPDPAREAARQYQLAVLLWGKGSGKDYLCSIVVAYLVYVLLCLRDPQGYFGLGPGENLDVLNVAYNADQAKKVFFSKFKERLYRWRWLRENFDVHEGGRRKWARNKGKPIVELNDGEVIFPRGIRCFSKHSQNESYEGLNVIAWVMDEASAFLSAAKKENAGKIYQTLRTSAASRFGMRWLGFIISYPRHADDFTMQKCAEARAHPEAGIYADGPASTWAINQMRGRDGMVEVRPGHHVPVELANDYTLDFEEALAKYECQPPLAKDALIKEPQRVWDAVRKGRKPLIEWEPIENTRDVVDGAGNEVTRTYAGVKLTKMGRLPKGARLFFHGDPARSSDAFALGFAHGVEKTVSLHVPAGEVLTAAQLQANDLQPDTLVPWERDVMGTVVDALLIWRPDPTRNKHVDLLNVQAVLLAIVEHYGRSVIGGGTFDQYDSAETVQRLTAKKFAVENEAWSNPFQHRIYRGARSAFYNDLVDLPDTPSITSEDPKAPGAVYELTRVEEIEGHKIDHPEGGSKDSADVIARLIEHVTGQLQRGFSFGSVGGQSQIKPGTVKVPGRTVDPNRPPSPVSPAEQLAESKRREQRPVDVELAPAQGTVRRAGKLSFGSLR